ncbi:MAG: hypothetical protein NTW19_22470, partial [Planctomycetota bacterium]|nr:hypothetical protein [Planctomycetota bacterium]
MGPPLAARLASRLARHRMDHPEARGLAMKAPQLDQLLRRVAARHRRVAVDAVGWAQLPVFLLACALAVLLDAVMGFGPAGLVGIDLALVTLVVLHVVSLRLTERRHRFDPRRVARLLEDRAKIDDSLLISAVQFAQAPTGRERDELAAMTLARAEAWAAGVRAESFDDPQARRRLNRARAAGMLALAAAAIALWAFSGAVRASSIRCAHPLSDFPPYTTVRFAIYTDPSPPRRDLPLTIVADVSGPPRVEQAQVVFAPADEHLGHRTSLAMISQDGRFTLSLPRAGDRRDFHIQTPAGRSAWYRIDPLKTPILTAITVRCEFPDYTHWPSRAESPSPASSLVLRALVGTRATFTLVAGGPLRDAVLTLTPDAAPLPGTIPGSGMAGAATQAAGRASQTLPFAIDVRDPSRASATFDVTTSAALTVEFTSADGTGSSSLTGRIEAVKDRPPTTTWVEPAETELAVPAGWPVELAATANDDVAVASMALEVDGRPIAAAIEGLDTPEARGRWTLDPAAMGLAVGSRFECAVVARDARPPEGQPSARSIRVVRVVSDEEYRALAAARYDPRRAAEEAQAFAQALARAAARHASLAARTGERRAPGEQANDRTAENAEDDRSSDAELSRHADDARVLASRLARRSRPPHLNGSDAEFAASLARAAAALDAAADASDALAGAMAASLDGGANAALGGDAA